MKCCEHFNGVPNGNLSCCRADINYRDVTGGREAGWLTRLPCVTESATRSRAIGHPATCAMFQGPIDLDALALVPPPVDPIEKNPFAAFVERMPR